MTGPQSHKEKILHLLTSTYISLCIWWPTLCLPSCFLFLWTHNTCSYQKSASPPELWIPSLSPTWGCFCGLHPLSYTVHISPQLVHPHAHALGISVNLHVSLTHFSTFFQLQTELLSPLPHPHNPLESGSYPYYSTETAVVEVTNVLHVVKSRGHLLFLSSLTSKVKSWWCPPSWNIFFLWLCDSSLSSFSSVSFIGSFSSTQSLEVRGYQGSVLSIVPAFLW